MNKKCHQRLPIAQTLLVILAILFALIPVPSVAQQGIQPALQITKIDTSEFPLVKVFVYSTGINADFAGLPVTLRENGGERPLISNETQTVGTQVALLLDSALSIANPGATGDAQYIEAGLAARRLVAQSSTRRWLSPDTDWMTSIVFGSGSEPKTLSPWTRDHQAVADSIYTFRPQEENLAQTTPLFDLLYFTANSLANSSPQETEGKTRSMVVFSDGFDQVSTTELTDLVLASTQAIPIHTVLIGRDVATQRQNLERISLLTGGTFVHLRTSVNDVDPIWEAIAKTKTQQVITYRSQSAQPRDVSVSVQLPDGRIVSTTAPIPSISIQPLRVVVQDPQPNLEIVREATQHDTPLNEIVPREIQIQSYFEWPDALPRELVKVEFEVTGAGVIERTEPPFDEFLAFPINSLDSGTYTLRIRATDELGVVGESDPIPFRVIVRRPPDANATREAQLGATATSEAVAAARAESEARTAAAEATAAAAAVAAEQGNAEARETAVAVKATADADRAIAQSTTEALATAQAAANATATAGQTIIETTQGQVRTLGWVSIASSALAVAALGLAIYVLSNRDRRRRATEIVTGTVKAVTQPFVRARKGKSVARLVLIDNAGTPGLQTTIPLRENSSLRIGRDPELVNVALEDKRVSRLHCRINQDTGGSFRILDEGSTTGTFVNDEEVGMHGVPLNPGDIIGIGPIEYRFENEESETITTPGNNAAPGTEPFRRAAKGS